MESLSRDLIVTSLSIDREQYEPVAGSGALLRTFCADLRVSL